MTTPPAGDDVTRDDCGPALGPGTRISNRYAIEELLGARAFGRVYRGSAASEASAILLYIDQQGRYIHKSRERSFG
jgi:hypothetical protein